MSNPLRSKYVDRARSAEFYVCTLCGACLLDSEARILHDDWHDTQGGNETHGTSDRPTPKQLARSDDELVQLTRYQMLADLKFYGYRILHPDDVQPALNNLRAFLAAYPQSSNLDAENIYTYNFHTLRWSELTAIAAVFGNDQ